MSRYNEEPNFVKIVGDILKRLDNSETKPRAGYTSISLTGSQTFTVLSSTGSLLFKLGSIGWGGGVFTSGFEARRQDNSLAFAIWGPDSAHQFVAMYDRSGNVVISDDTSSGVGIARPWLPIAWMTTPEFNGAVNTVGTTYNLMARASCFKQHPKLDIGVYHSAASGTAILDYKVIAVHVTDGPTEILPPTTVGVGANFDTAVVDLPGGFGDGNVIELWARMTTGAGPFYLTFSHLWGRQT